MRRRFIPILSTFSGLSAFTLTFTFSFTALVVFAALFPAPAYADTGEAAGGVGLAPHLLTLLVPVGLMLVAVSALPEDEAVSAVTGGVVAWGLAVLAYFLAGFAFQFGGAALVVQGAGLDKLYWEYSLLDTSWGPGWGMVGLKGFLLGPDASTPAAHALFLAHLSPVGVMALVPYFALRGRFRPVVAIGGGILGGAFIYPLAGNWAWGGGWLGNLGSNLSQGHGLVDFGGAGVIHLLAGATALAVILAFRRAPGAAVDVELDLTEPSASLLGAAEEEQGEPFEPMPPVHLPILGLLGALLAAVGWLGFASGPHLPTTWGMDPALAAVNIGLGAFGAALMTSLYSWFVTGRNNTLMTARGVVAGLVVTSGAAPFVEPWAALALGLVMGALTPLSIYLFENVLNLEDSSALTVHAAAGLLGLIAAGFLASGAHGAGWNGTGAEEFLGVDGQGVSGLWVAAGFASDWPGQMYAQLTGAVSLAAWGFALPFALFRGIAAAVRSWEKTGLEFGTVPVPGQKPEEESIPEPEQKPEEEHVPEPGEAETEAETGEE